MKTILRGLLAVLRYIKARIIERSFWLQCGAAIVPAVALPMPYRAISIAIAVMAALVPDGTIKTAPNK